MRLRFVAAGLACVGLGLAAWAAFHNIGHPDVIVRAVRPRAEVSVRVAGLRSVPAERSGPSAAPASVGQPDPATPIKQVDSHRFVDELATRAHLDDGRRAALDRHVQAVAAMQARIDKHTDPAERAELEQRLMRQLHIRLRLIVGDELATSTVASLETEHAKLVEGGAR